jgi:hypothetical protein
MIFSSRSDRHSGHHTAQAELSRLSDSFGDLLHSLQGSLPSHLPGIQPRQSWLERWVGPVRDEVRGHWPEALGGSRGSKASSWSHASFADLLRAVAPAAAPRQGSTGARLLAGAVLLVGIGLVVGLAARR